MNIGKKIKSIRSQKQMTQRQLAGDHITRNMLSRIENGGALPSLQTIIYLAGRLNISPGFLLAEGEEELLFRKFYRIENIKRAYRDGELRICRDLCRGAGLEEEDEICLILACCALGIAKEEFASGRLRSAGGYLEEAVDSAGRGAYCNDSFRAEAAVYFRYMRKISPTLGGELTGPPPPEGLSHGDRFCRYVIALEALDSLPPGGKSDGIIGQEAFETDDPYAAHIRARRAMREENFDLGGEALRSILNSNSAIPDPVLYAVFCDLELCSRESNDYRSAYEYAAVGRNLLERMLSEPEG